jgi:cytochrome b561
MLLLFIFQWGSILVFRHLEETTIGVEPPMITWSVLNAHKSVGLIILTLGVLRLTWRKYTPLPDWPTSFNDWDKSVSHFAEWGLYTCMMTMSISGILIEFWGGHYIPLFNLFYLDNLAPFFHAGTALHTPELDAARAAGINTTLRDFFVVIHIMGAFVFIGLLSVHLSHIIRHQRHLKDKILARMLPQRNSRERDSQDG